MNEASNANAGANDLETTCEAVSAKLDAGEAFVLIDCREPDEHAVASVAAARLIPMGEIPARLETLEPHREQSIVVMCHHGMRSAQVAVWLRGQGFAKAQSMAGGIDLWSQAIDPSVPRY
ncbi:MAG: rhodanese-like domain-containing protein [Planctomycetota bacterium]